MTTKHTPAPWIVTERAMLFEIEGTTGFLVAEIEKVFTEEDAIEVTANCKLIAAAPEMLEALILITDEFDAITCILYNKFVEQAHAAIAKAKGES